MDEDREVDLHRESIWISYSATALDAIGQRQLSHFTSHRRLAAPVSPWETLKIGSGTPPVMTLHGWLIVYHGVSEVVQPGDEEHRLTYSAGVMVLSKKYPHELLYRSTEPLLVPVPSEQRQGTFANVVFPTGIDRRDDIDQPHRHDVYYGMNDFRIGVARLATLTEPSGASDAAPFSEQARNNKWDEQLLQVDLNSCFGRRQHLDGPRSSISSFAPPN